MKSRSLCAQRKMAQRLPLEHSRGLHSPGPRLLGDDWESLLAVGCVATGHGADRDVDMFALGPGDAAFSD